MWYNVYDSGRIRAAYTHSRSTTKDSSSHGRKRALGSATRLDPTNAAGESSDSVVSFSRREVLSGLFLQALVMLVETPRCTSRRFLFTGLY